MVGNTLVKKKNTDWLLLSVVTGLIGFWLFQTISATFDSCSNRRTHSKLDENWLIDGWNNLSIDYHHSHFIASPSPITSHNNRMSIVKWQSSILLNTFSLQGQRAIYFAISWTIFGIWHSPNFSWNCEFYRTHVTRVEAPKTTFPNEQKVKSRMSEWRLLKAQ